MSHEFDWSPDNEDICAGYQRCIAVYTNPWNQCVIRQEREWDEEEDTWIRINIESLPALIARLQELLPPKVLIEQPERPPSSGAERQRRYRLRHRRNVTGVTPAAQDNDDMPLLTAAE